MLLLFIMAPMGMVAQKNDGVFEITCNSWLLSGGLTEDSKDTKRERSMAYYCMAENKDIAQEIKGRFEAVKDKSQEKIDKFFTEWGFRKERKGIFRENVTVGQWILCVDDENNFKMEAVVAGKTEYDFKYMSNLLSNVNITKTSDPVPAPTTRRRGNTYTFEIKLPVQADRLTDHTRLILQCKAINCQSENIEDFCGSVVYEGKEYHQLQDKRKDFDFFKKDSLGGVYAGSWDRFAKDEAGRVVVTAQVEYTPQYKDSTYRGDWFYTFEDYHRPYLEGSVAGTCLQINPFKFLDLAATTPDMELAEEFRKTAQVQRRQVDTRFDINFKVGKAILEEDSLNDVKRDNLLRELESYGVLLTSIEIIGGASPDGRLDKNTSLAEDRARKALSMTSDKLPRSLERKVNYKVFTWKDVTDSLRMRKMNAQADSLSGVLAENEGAGADELFQVIRNLPFYGDEGFQAILVNMRSMTCSYSYIDKRVLSETEVVEEYYKHKREYVSGEQHFSSGDYFNLFKNVRDSVEQDTITMLAWRDMHRDRNHIVNDELAPYVYNRMQRLRQKMGMPDTLMLRPLLRYNNTFDTIVGVGRTIDIDGVRVKMNRRDLVITQILSYYQLEKYGEALGLLDWLEANDKKGEQLGIENLRRIMEFIEYYRAKDPVQKRRFEVAKNYILNMSDLNKAIIFTEMPDLDEDNMAEAYTDMMDDSDPKKWYLKGILWSRKMKRKGDPQEDYKIYLPENEEALANDSTGMAETADVGITESELEDIRMEVPYYLAFFHHCFKIQPYFQKYYYAEGQVDEKKRETMKFIRKDVPAYEIIFDLLKRREDDLRESTLARIRSYEERKGFLKDEEDRPELSQEAEGVAAGVASKEDEKQL